MATLDTRGKIAAAEIGFYAPPALLCGYLVFRYALRRDAGWLFLFIFSLSKSSLICICVLSVLTLPARMATGGLLVAAQLVTPPNNSLFLGSYILDYAGILPLLFSSLGFIGMA